MPEVALKVAMACSGCSGAVERVLGKLPGVQKVEIDMPTQKVVVTTDNSLDADTVFKTVSGTGKATEYWS